MNQDLIKLAHSLCEGEGDPIANMANLSALINQHMNDLNWVGFYLYKEDSLVLGPFQGKVACTRLPLGKGVCMKALENGTTLVVDDVHAFPGHIACDAQSRSELVVPIFKEGQPYAVLDLDSPLVARFNDDDATTLTVLIDTVKAFIGAK